MKGNILFFFIFLFFLSNQAVGQTVLCHEYQVGDQFLYETEDNFNQKSFEELYVLETSKSEIKVRNQTGNLLVFSKTFDTIKSWSGRVYSPKRYRLPDCPFTPSYTGSYRVDFTNPDGGKGQGTVNLKVGSTYTNKGGFQVIHVISEYTYSYLDTFFTGGATLMFEGYYAPEIGVFVQFSESYSPKRGANTSIKWTLKKYVPFQERKK